jgi:paraquat-inducible protein B
MNTTQKSADDFPHAVVRRRVALSFIWLAPIIAGIVALVLVIQNLQQFGPVITIRFDNAAGLAANQTLVRYRGVRVGSVLSIKLTQDLRDVEVKARLQRFAAGLAREGSVFWIVRPEVGAAGIHALETIVSGPYIEVLPGDVHGKPQRSFIGADEAPVVADGQGTEFILRASLIRSLGPNSPVYFRGLLAGKVQYLELSPDSTVVNVHVLIKPNFTPLVRANTVWWNAGGIDVSWHLRSGLSMTAENLKSLVTGGVGFATPNDPGAPATPGTVFELNEKPDLKWLEWSPHISITNATVVNPATPAPMDLDTLNQPPRPP